MPRKANKSKGKSSKNGPQSMVTLLKQIQLNTATNVAQVVPDTVIFPILKPHRAFSVILSYQTFSVNSTTVPTYFTISPVLSAMSGYTDYTSAFDKYRILEVQCDFIPNIVGVATTSSATTSTVIDYDDNSNLTTGAAMEYDSCYNVNSSQTFKRTFIPKISMAAYSGAFTSFMEPKAGQWVDCASPNVIHYGLKGVIAPSTPAFATNIFVRAHIQFSHQH